MFKTLQNKVSQVPSEFIYKLEHAKYASKLPKLAPSDQQIVDALNIEGVFVTSLEDLGFTSTSQLLNSAMSLLPSMAAATSTNSVNNRCINGYTAQARPAKFITVTDYPDFFLWGLDERLLDIIENYIGLPVAYHGVNFRRDLGNEQMYTQLWHKDGEDRRIVKVIIYLSDVGEDNGPFEYIPKPLTPSYQSFIHLYRKILRTGFSGISDEELNRISPKSALKACLGSAGTIIFVDTRNVFHRGKPPRAERSSLFYVYTSKSPKRPDICKANFNFDRDGLIALAKKLPQRQKECVLWDEFF